jgi:hypothetical protein
MIACSGGGRAALRLKLNIYPESEPCNATGEENDFFDR